MHTLLTFLTSQFPDFAQKQPEPMEKKTNSLSECGCKTTKISREILLCFILRVITIRTINWKLVHVYGCVYVSECVWLCVRSRVLVYVRTRVRTSAQLCAQNGKGNENEGEKARRGDLSFTLSVQRWPLLPPSTPSPREVCMADDSSLCRSPSSLCLLPTSFLKPCNRYKAHTAVLFA